MDEVEQVSSEPEPERQSVLDVSSLTKRYGQRTALSELSLRVVPGQIHGLLGPNGSGKTTCLHLITGLLEPDEGEVSVVGIPVRSKESRAYLGMAPDDLPLPASLTGHEYLRFHDRLRQRDDSTAAAELAAAFSLELDLGRQIAEYSHGMKRKLQVIAAVMHFPELLVLDEPYRGLDPDAAATLRSLLMSFAARGGAVLVATHDMLRAQRDCSFVTVLHLGAVVAQGPPDAVQQQHSADSLEDAFMAATGLQKLQQERSEQIDAMMSEGWESR